MGDGAFCIKACDPARPNAANFCQHTYDRIGCAYNAPNNASPNVFESCLGDDQDFPGVYTQQGDGGGRVMTYTQPPAASGDVTSMPYQPRVPASSGCRTFESGELYPTATMGVVQGRRTSTSTSTSGRPGGDGGGGKAGTRAVAASFASKTSGAVHRHYRYMPRGANIASVVGAVAFKLLV
jgi:hypothetical protein